MFSTADMAKRSANPELPMNRLWLARKRAGFLLKWVAKLLGRRSIASVCEYESGRKLPTLPTAIRLELIYGMPMSALFPDLYRELAGEISALKARMPQLRRREGEMRESHKSPHQLRLALP